MDSLDMQKVVDEWLKEVSPNKPYWNPLSILVQMQAELGELADEVNKLYGDKPRKIGEQEIKNKIKEEVGDLLFAIICLCNSLDIYLEDAYRLTINKFKTRDKDRHNK
ncbi:nucleotide pyrophosphohydrolase [Candidatus Woesearchaeota archaeon]|nr:nucleotide pyrophosphohydrolase [Candidatus Woesearchaeota archaeon]